VSGPAERIRRAGWRKSPQGTASTEAGSVEGIDGRPLSVVAWSSNPAFPSLARIEIASRVLDLDAARDLAAILAAVLAVASREQPERGHCRR
jgi:hypothetical protein